MVEKFDPKGHARMSFKDWYRRNFEEGKDIDKIIEHAKEIMEAAEYVLKLTYERSGKEIVKYYKDDLPNIKAAYDKKDWKKFAFEVDSFVGGIEWE
jgi:hypothetical protein